MTGPKPPARKPVRMTSADYAVLMARGGLRPAAKAPPAGPVKAEKPKPNRAAKKRNQVVRPPKVVTPKLPIRSRGPWLLEVDDRGRPMTVNDERSGTMNRATMHAVRAEKAAWAEGIIAAVEACQIPPLKQVYLVFQPFYGNNSVPDPDGLSPLHKTVIDALVKAGVLANDTRAQLPLGYAVLPPVTDGGPCRMTCAIFPLP